VLASEWANQYICATMSLAESSRRLTETEYLEIERAAHFKSEFFDGEMFAMAGGTPLHSLIAVNFAAELRNQLKGRPCAVYNSDLRIKVEATGLFTYPDVSVVCGPLDFAEGTDDTVLNPALIVEVLSDSTEAYDRGKKFENYRQIGQLRAYLMAGQNEPRIEQFTRQNDGNWLLSEAAGVESRLEIPSLGMAISLAEVFANVTFNPTAIRPTAAVRS
jgi:Uma2 family endonuclease